MFIPPYLRLIHPFVARWRGESGRLYEFAVLRAESISVAAPAVFLLGRAPEDRPAVLYVGHCDRFEPSAPELRPVWLLARERCMSHLYLSMEAAWRPVREAQVADLISALRPELNEQFPAAGVEALPVEPTPVEPATIYAFPPPRQPSVEFIEEGETVAASRVPDPPRKELLDDVPNFERSSQRLSGALSRLLFGRFTRGGTGRETGLALVSEDLSVTPELPSVPPAAAAPDKPAPLPPALSPSRSEPQNARAKLGFDEGTAVVLFSGAMSSESGVGTLVEAIVTVASTDPLPLFVLAGSGPEMAGAVERIKAAGVGHRCRFPGELDTELSARYLDACSYLVVPAHGRADPALPERALAMGIPVLTTHSAMLAAVRHGENGLVAYDNANSLVWGLREGLSRWTGSAAVAGRAVAPQQVACGR